MENKQEKARRYGKEAVEEQKLRRLKEAETDTDEDNRKSGKTKKPTR